MDRESANGATSENFNPYLSWFQIAKSNGPLNAYQLLGLRELETDRKRIQSAVEQRHQELKVHRGSEYTAVWQRVTREIDGAAQTLSDLDLKAILDADIRRARRAARVGNDSKRPDTPVKLTCGTCAQENSGRRSFCSNCGNALWRVCSQCESESPAAETFCGSCGVNLAEYESHVLAAESQRLEEAVELRSALRFSEALQRLRPLAIHEDPRLEPLIRKAQSYVRRWRDEQGEWRLRAQSDFEAAECCFGEKRFEQAKRILERVPVEFREDRIRALLEEAVARCRELTELEKEIRQAVEDKSIAGLGAKIDRLLQLDPGHKECHRLAPKLSKLLEQAAEKKLAEGRYTRAQELLADVPGHARGTTHAQLSDQAEELLWLQNSIEQAEVADEIVLGMAERLVAACPADAKAARWLTDLRSLHTNGRLPSPWATLEEIESTVGPPVRLVPPWSRIDTRAVAHDSIFVQQPGCWNVACGLALQGLEISAISLNLAKRKKNRLFAPLAAGRRKSSPRRAWGIDIGAMSLRAIELIRHDDGRVSVGACRQGIWKKPLNRVEDDAQRMEFVTEGLKSFVDKHSLAEIERICIGLPGQWTLTRTIGLPPIPDKQRHDVITFEAKHQFPIPLECLVWDHQHVRRSNQADTNGMHPGYAVLLAAKREFVEARQAMVERCGLQVVVLQSGALALYNLAAHEQFWASQSSQPLGSAGEAFEPATALLDLGGESTSLVIGAPDLVWCRTLPITGDSFTDPLLKNLQLTHDQAEQVKREPLRAKRLHRLYRQIEPVVRELARELRRSFDVFHKDYPRHRVQNLYLAGGGALLHGLVRLLRSVR